MGVVSAGIPTGYALATVLTMPVAYQITNSYHGVFLFWSIPPIVAAALWWYFLKPPLVRKFQTKPENTNGTVLKSLLQNRNIWLIAVLFLLSELFIFAWLGWAPALLVFRGATPELAGVLTSIVPWVGIPIFFLMPYLSHRSRRKKPFLWIPCIVLALTAWGAMYINLNMIWLIILLMGIADNTKYVIMLTLPTDIVQHDEVGGASGIILSMGYAGGAIGPWVSGKILDATGSLDLSLVVMIGVAIASLGLALLIPETGGRRIH